MSKVALVKLIRLPKPGKRVTISIRVANGQSGLITFNVSGQPVQQKDGSFDYKVENSESLSGKSFDFNVVCTDMNPDSNNLEVHIDLFLDSENKGPWVLSREVEDHGSYQFFGTIEFV